MRLYEITGMSCAACSARIEKEVSKVEGVISCSVNLLTNTMSVEGSALESDIMNAVVQAGYGIAARQTGTGQSDMTEDKRIEEALQDRETPILKKRLCWSVIFLAVLMYFSMGHMMWNWPVPSFFEENDMAQGLLQMLLAGMIMVINRHFFISGSKSLWQKSPNMDTLVAMGAGAAFGYSLYALFAMTEAVTTGDAAGAMDYMHELYFESAAMILTLITLGKMLEAKSKGKTTDALKGLIKLTPRTATVVRNGMEATVAIQEIQKGDVFVVRPGESIPADGRVLEGNSAVWEAALTGESIPADKEAGSAVWAATVNQSGFLKCEAVQVGEDTALSQIIRMVSDAAATKAPIAKAADKVSGIFVPTVMGIAVLTFLIWLATGATAGFALARGISVLVISCPCALGLATPVAIMVGSGVGAGNGILFKTAEALETAGKMEIIALDKTGTLTEGNPKVTDVIPADEATAEEVCMMAYALEKKSEHPLAKAVTVYAEDQGFVAEEVTQFQAFAGNGLTAWLEGQKLAGGNAHFISRQAEIPEKMQQQAEQLARQGKTPLFFAKGGKLLGMIAVADVIRTDSQQAVKELQHMGIRVIMLTGDHEQTAQAVGKQAGVDEVIAGLLPDEKARAIERLQQQGRTAMAGDGINDAPALTQADLGIAVGAGTDIAIDAADVVLMKNSLRDIPAAVRLSRGTLKNIYENLFWAFGYNLVGIPLAAGIWIPVFGWKLNPMFAAAAMSLSSFCVVSNALRLNLLRIHNTDRYHKIKKQKRTALQTQDKEKPEEKVMMTKRMQIEGMMCAHCEARVKKCLEDLDMVEQVRVSHEEGIAVVTLKDKVDDRILKEAVEAQDYTVVSIK